MASISNARPANEIRLVEPKSDEKKETVSDNELIVTRLTDTAIKPVRWLWQDRFAYGAISIVAGLPDGGKTTMCLDIAARVTTGRSWSDGSGAAEIGNILIMSAEDDPARTLKPRFLAAGGNPNRASIIEAVKTGDKRRPFSLSTDVERLLKLYEREKPSLIIIDPLSAYLGRVDSHKNAEVRAALTPLADMTIKSDVAVILVSHLNKGGSEQDALSRVTGSLAFVAAARSVYLVTADKEDKDRKLLLPIKNNLAATKTGLAFRLENKRVDDDVFGVAPIWEPDPVEDINADDALRRSDDRDNTESLIAYIERKGGKVTPRDLVTSHKFATAESAELALRGLMASGEGQLTTSASGPKGGRPRTEFVLSSQQYSANSAVSTTHKNPVKTKVTLSADCAEYADQKGDLL